MFYNDKNKNTSVFSLNNSRQSIKKVKKPTVTSSTFVSLLVSITHNYIISMRVGFRECLLVYCQYDCKHWKVKTYTCIPGCIHIFQINHF